jgi:hypothetical protein
VVIVLTAWFLIAKLSPWRRLAGGHSPEGVISQATMVAVFGLAVSLGVAALYPFLTRTIYPGQERDYLKAYGFRDFYYVFGYSFAIAVVCWVIAFLLYLLAPAFCWLFVPEPGDDQSALVRKIGLRGMFGGRSNFPRVTSGAQGALRLAERSGGKTLVAPAVLVDLDAGTPAKAKAKEDIAKAANGDHPFRLWRRTRHAKRKEGAELVWLPGDIPAPSLADGSTLTGNAQPSPIVRTQ